MTQKPKIFIDGEVGTTGLQIYTRLSKRDDIDLIRIDPDKRKDPKTRSQSINAADLAILCLPDEASKEAAYMVEPGSSVKLLDASSAHRTAPDWVYGFPELNPNQRALIESAPRVSNPGCYPTGFISAVQPLVKAGLIPADYPLTLNAISGYSGGGKQMIEQYKGFHQAQSDNISTYPYGIYGLKFGHKHIQEMHRYTGLSHAPLFVPSVGDFEQGMLVQVPLPLWAFENSVTGEQIHQTLTNYYQTEKFVEVAPYQGDGYLREGKFLDVQEVNGTNVVQIFVFANNATQEALLVSRLDNLGKGASGAAIQNLNIMLGFPEALGLV
jgi:N-acetyl-gamma-glutamyl-phosphate reductase